MDEQTYPLVFSKAYAEMSVSADFKLLAEDFCVDEVLSFEPSGEGEHVFIQVKKTALTTDNIVSDISRTLKLNKRDIGYSGLKDKQAVTTQWLSFVWPVKEPIPELGAYSWEVLQSHRHLRKLKRGVHKHNRFFIRLKNIKGDLAALEQRLQLLSEQGVPNYFGLQRFGHGGGNVEKAEGLFQKRFKCKKFQRGMYYSAARSYLFNHYLQQRVMANNWNVAVEGDCYQLHGTQSLFGPEPICDKIVDRIKINDIHLVGPLIGLGESRLESQALAFEHSVKEQFSILTQGLIDSGLKQNLRALRLIPEQMQWQFMDDCCEIEFTLPPGAFATAVLHELAMINGESW